MQPETKNPKKIVTKLFFNVYLRKKIYCIKNTKNINKK